MFKRLFGTAFLVSISILALSTTGNAQYYGRAQQSAGSLEASNNAPQNVLIILDASGSMESPMGNVSRIQAAKDVVIQTVKNLPPNVNVGLRVFGYTPNSSNSRNPFGSIARRGCESTTLLVPIGQNNRATIASQMLNVEAVGDRTPITNTLNHALQSDFINIPGKKTIILVSDGEDNCPGADPCKLAINAVRMGVDVKINTISIGVQDYRANDQLKCVALSTKGKFYTADTAAQLAKSMQDSIQVQTRVQGRIYTGQ